MSAEGFEVLRQHMPAEISAGTFHVSGLIGKAALDERVMTAMGKAPRHEFVPVELQPYAYANIPLPISVNGAALVSALPRALLHALQCNSSRNSVRARHVTVMHSAAGSLLEYANNARRRRRQVSSPVASCGARSVRKRGQQGKRLV
jgi:Protein-L-isoaspartate(D-aspartate) O-methyltransferase (PCMT)